MMRQKVTGRTPAERLLSSAKQVKSDMLMRARVDDDGTKIVNMSNGVWRTFCECIEAMENRE